MKRIWRLGAVFLCVVMFISLLFIAVRQTNRESHEPKPPVSVRFMAIARSTDPTSIVVELPEKHNADRIIMYFGDELGYFEPPIATFEVTENPMICNMPKDIVMPENATMIWVYTANEYGTSMGGMHISLAYAPDPAELDKDNVEDKEISAEKYTVILIATALLISFVGYVLLGKKTPDEPSETKEADQNEI